MNGAAIAQWVRLCLPSCSPGFDPQAQHLRFFNLYLNCDEKKRYETKRVSRGPLKNLNFYCCC